MATHRISVLNKSFIPVADAFFESYERQATNDFWKGIVLIVPDNDADVDLHGFFEVQQNYVGSAAFGLHWTSTATTGNIDLEILYRAVGGDDAESLDQATAQETVTGWVDTAPSVANRKLTTTQAITSANLAAGDIVEFIIRFDAGDTTNYTLADEAIVFDIFFQYADA